MNEIISDGNLALFLRLLIAHLLGDFLFQHKNWIIQKKTKGWKAASLYFHVLIIGLLTYLFSGYYHNFWIPLFIMVTHLAADIWKSTTEDNAKEFIIDQLIHIIVLVIAWYLYLYDQVAPAMWLSDLAGNVRFLALAVAYIIVIWPSGYLIAKITKPWQEQVEINKGLPEAGRWIGIIERILILTFVLVDQYSGIGFLIAAKSILRFGDIKDSKNRKEAEYILIGTMISFIVAILTGIFTLQMIRT